MTRACSMSRVPLNGRRPGMLGRAEIEDLLKYAVYLSEADETEAVIEASDLSLTRFARNAIHQNVAETDALLEVRAVFRRRVGAASTNDLSRAGVYRTVKRACALARHAPENPDWPGLPEPQPLPEVQAFDEAVAGMTPEGRGGAGAGSCGGGRRGGGGGGGGGEGGRRGGRAPWRTFAATRARST